MASISVKDPSCYHVTLRSYSPEVAKGLAKGIPLGGVNGIVESIQNQAAQVIATGVQTAVRGAYAQEVNIQGVFASDGNAVSIESTTEEDEYTEALDGSVCVFPKSNRNKILTIRLNSCNGVLNDIIGLKERRFPSNGRNIIRVPIWVQFCDYCADYVITAECAWILSNPTVSFGQDDSAVEVRILLVEPRSNKLVFTSDYDARVEEVVAGNVAGTIIN